MGRLVAVGLVVMLLSGALHGAAIRADGRVGGTTVTPQTLETAENFDTVEFHITVYDNGSARWTFYYLRTLKNESEHRQFEAFAAEFNNNSTRLYEDFRREANALAERGSNETGRPMDAKDFSKQAYVGGLSDNRGIVEMSFEWTVFAASDNETFVIGDVFEGGLYLGPNQSLVVHAGPGLQFASAQPRDGAIPSGDSVSGSESLTWEGERDFVDQRPRVKFEPMDRTTTTTTTTEAGENDTEDPVGGSNTSTTPNAGGQPGSGDGDWPPLMMFVTAVLVLLGLAAAFAWRQGDFGSLSAGSNPGGGDGGAGLATGGESGPAKPSVSDEELLTDEARVKKLLDDNGGRMKQVNIVEETGWSKSKVSMLLSEMEDDGEISKLRVGRENIISLEGHEPDAAGSPLED